MQEVHQTPTEINSATLETRIRYAGTELWVIESNTGRLQFTSQVMDLWAYRNGVKIDFSRPGKPTDNAFVESFNGTFRFGVPGHPLVHRSEGGQTADRSLEAGIQLESSSRISR